jgi:hypothetical protein
MPSLFTETCELLSHFIQSTVDGLDFFVVYYSLCESRTSCKYVCHIVRYFAVASLELLRHSDKILNGGSDCGESVSLATVSPD